jgi:hypothetical protein
LLTKQAIEKFQTGDKILSIDGRKWNVMTTLKIYHGQKFKLKEITKQKQLSFLYYQSNIIQALNLHW